ncbi:MAG: LamG domain-containing protein [Prosthecobacter sp.]|uniref:LamG domain-containing protein n=1 Tax=Prosthecobacter sp. TaxID=1965333 RepID=UPI003902E26B
MNPACLSLLLGSSLMTAQAADLSALMPHAADHTQMWWAEGFPLHTPTAPWLRVIQTGRYAMALNTQTLRVEHLGAVVSLMDDYRRLPAAELALNMSVDGKNYRCTAGGKWSRFTGPRLIESGRFFQRGDVTDLEFKAEDGSRLNVEARFETAAWTDRLGLILAARPGVLPIVAGEQSFGHVGGGFGLDGANHLEIPHSAALDAEQFTMELWAFVPQDYQAGQHSPWLMCRGPHEAANGNMGFMIANGQPRAHMNIGGGAANAVVAKTEKRTALKLDAWNHLAMSYDGDTLRLFVNGGIEGETMVGKKRLPCPGALAFGRRQDNTGDGFHFRGVVDEIRFFDRALKPEETRAAVKPVLEWTFNAQGKASKTKLRETWKQVAMEIYLTTPKGKLHQRSEQIWTDSKEREVSLVLDPVTGTALEVKSPVIVAASEKATGVARAVVYEPSLSWHRINLDGIAPTAPPGGQNPSNDAVERVMLQLSNPTDSEQIARLMFEKTTHGFHQRIGTPITGVSAILRDADGNPTGIPVQLSKNWHNEPEGGVYASQWFHGISQVRLPAKASIELELTLAYGHWGGVAAASHAQLCLIGWGSNQLWDQSALGAWGESICYEPDQAQANCTITDVRPAMLYPLGEDKRWGWTSNVGGGDFLRLFDPAGQRVSPSAMRTTYHKHGPCLTEVTYAGRIGTSIAHSTTVSLARTDDIVRGVYRLRFDVTKALDFSRFVLFQIGADTYTSTSERKMALGNETGLIKEWNTQWGGDIYRTAPLECTGRIPWISLHEGELRAHQNNGAGANRGIVIRSWKARLGGKDAAPWIAERGVTRHRQDAATLDLVPPPGVTRFEPGDFVEATIEHLIIPQSATDYYGPNEALRTALTKDANTWRMIQREALGNDRRIEMKHGELQRTHPAITISTADDKAEFTLAGGIGYVPITFTGLSSPRGFTLFIDDKPVNQSIHGNDFWQTDYDSATQQWSQTYNLTLSPDQPHMIRFQ